jgi:D-alanine-D-alanine ligase-like ATP-grasp enzyme
MSKKTIGVVFGSRSVEHDVSIVTGHQVMRALDPNKYEVVPIYIARDGRWFTGAGLRDLKNFQASDLTQVKDVFETLPHLWQLDYSKSPTSSLLMFCFPPCMDHMAKMARFRAYLR